MKTIITTLLMAVIFFSCKTGESLTKQETITQITGKVESGRYTFKPTTAIPMGGKSINISYSYSLKISKDTIEAFLPYYGVSYSAPMTTDDAGIKFKSTDFKYTISEKNSKGMWDVKIDVNDNRKNYKLFLSIGDTGYTTLSVQDNERQSISFYGNIE